MFQGFSFKTFDFLYDLYFNNERLWFNANKQRYIDHLYTPMKALSQEVFAALTDTFPQKELQCKVARIYKDARIYKGISCFKESLWFSVLGPCPSPSLSPALWFEVWREGWSCGMGYYRPSAAVMARHREAIERDPRPLDRLYQQLLSQDRFILRGKPYAKLRRGAPAHLAFWYNCKSFELIHKTPDVTLLFDGPAFRDQLVKDFIFLMPFFDYFYPLSDAAHGKELPRR